MEKTTEPYKCEICNYVTFVKKNLLWHNSCESHLSKVRNIKPTAVSILKEIENFGMYIIWFYNKFLEIITPPK